MNDRASATNPPESNEAGTAVGHRLDMALGLVVAAQFAAARTNAHDGSLVSGYRASFLVATGIAVAAVLIVAIQMRTRTVRKGPDDV